MKQGIKECLNALKDLIEKKDKKDILNKLTKTLSFYKKNNLAPEADVVYEALLKRELYKAD